MFGVEDLPQPASNLELHGGAPLLCMVLLECAQVYLENSECAEEGEKERLGLMLSAMRGNDDADEEKWENVGSVGIGGSDLPQTPSAPRRVVKDRVGVSEDGLEAAMKATGLLTGVVETTDCPVSTFSDEEHQRSCDDTSSDEEP